MASPSLLRTTSRVRQDAYICANCAFRARRAPARIPRRAVHQSVIEKDWKALKRWEQDAKEIMAGKKQSTLSILEERGLVHTIAGKREEVDQLMTLNRVGAYVGIDPTAASLHVGHLLPLMSLFWMFVRGHHSISLVGGATAKIGDPTDRLTTRAEQDAAVRTSNLVAMHYQLKRIWENVEVYGRKHGLKGTHKWTRELVNNATWMNKLTVMELLQIMGPGMRMGPMMARDTVKNKMAKGDGMSFAEFTYPILQGWDWWHMYQTKGIQMQIGGADQFGNITAGIDAVKYVSKHHPSRDVREAVEKHAPPVGFTVPLLTTSSGAKFGKSAGNAIWLDKAMTSSFDLYGFFLRTADADVGKYLKLFTFVPLEQIEEVVKAHMQSPKERKAQHLLAREFLEIIHGVEEAKAAELQHRLMFSKANAIPRPASSFASAANGPDGSDFKEQIVLNNAPTATMKLPHSLIHTRSIGRILYAAGLASSSSEGHRLAGQQSIYIGGHPGGYMQPMTDGTLTFTKVKLWHPEHTQKFLIGGKLLILRKGKHNIRTIEVVGDKEFVNEKLSFPGWEEMEELQRWMPQPIEGAMRRERRLERERQERIQLENKQADEEVDEKFKTGTESRAAEGGPASGSTKATSFDELAQYPVDIYQIRHRGRDDPGWKNAHWHPYYIIGKGQLNQYPGTRLGDPIPGVTPLPTKIQEIEQRLASVEPPQKRKTTKHRRRAKEQLVMAPLSKGRIEMEEAYKRFAAAQPRELKTEFERKRVKDRTPVESSRYVLKSEREREEKRKRREREAEQEEEVQSKLGLVNNSSLEPPRIKSMIDESPRRWISPLASKSISLKSPPESEKRKLQMRIARRFKEVSPLSIKRRRKGLNLQF